MLLLLTFVSGLASALPVPANAPEDPPAAQALPRSAVEARLLADLDARLADPAAYQAQVHTEAGQFPEGALFPYVLPILAMANLSRRPDADRAALLARMATLLDLLIPEVAQRTKAPSPDAIPDQRGHGTWRGELAMALGAWTVAGGDGRYEALQQRLLAALMAELVARRGAPIDAYPGLVWPFDTMPVLVALATHQPPLPGAKEAMDAHLRWLDAHLDPSTALPPSRIDLETGRIIAVPRGGELALRVGLLAQIDPALAKTYYQRLVAHFSVQVFGISGFSEYPDGQVGRADLDSGPVLFGLGMSATGLMPGAARAAGDVATAQRLDAELAVFPQLLPSILPLAAPELARMGIAIDTRRYVTGFLFGDAALLWAVTWEDWGLAR